MNIDTIFDGWGTEIISIIIGAIISGTTVMLYKKGKVKQKQTAKDYAKQKQVVRRSQEKRVRQKQVAGNNVEQTQIG
ncbi:MAG: hypothetical protein IKB70_06560 [Bacilli bacterium]|nr:hypothetical protein [Bacilli bacterium]